jgi:hypothetical protein
MTEPCLHHPALNNSVIFYYASDEDRAKYAKDWPKDKSRQKKNHPSTATGVCRKARSDF